MARTIIKRRRTGVYGGVSAEQRRDERRRKLMDAALEIIAVGGWSHATVRRISERAQVGPRYFYEAFDDLDDLAGAVLEEIVEAALVRTLEAVAAAPDEPPARVRAAFQAIFSELVDDPRRARLLFSEAHGSASLMRRRSAAIRAIAGALAVEAGAMLNYPPEGETLMVGISLVMAGGMAELVLVWLDGGLDISREQLIDLCVELLLTTGQSSLGITRRLTE